MFFLHFGTTVSVMSMQVTHLFLPFFCFPASGPPGNAPGCVSVLSSVSFGPFTPFFIRKVFLIFSPALRIASALRVLAGVRLCRLFLLLILLLSLLDPHFFAVRDNKKKDRKCTFVSLPVPVVVWFGVRCQIIRTVSASCVLSPVWSFPFRRRILILSPEDPGFHLISYRLSYPHFCCLFGIRSLPVYPYPGRFRVAGYSLFNVLSVPASRVWDIFFFLLSLMLLYSRLIYFATTFLNFFKKLFMFFLPAFFFFLFSLTVYILPHPP